MTDEIKDGFERLKELAQSIQNSVNGDKKSLAKAQIRKLIADLDVIESEIELNDEF